MSRSDQHDKPKARLVAAIVAIIVLLSASGALVFGLSKQAEYERRSDERSREYTSDTYGPAYNSCQRLPFASQFDCIAEANEERRENSRKEGDLVAQQAMSIWTFIMGGAAIVGMFLSAVGVYLVYTTFQATRKTADAATHMNEIATKAIVADHRPWLTIELPTFHKVTVSKGVITDEWENFIENSGKSAAIRVKQDVKYSVGGVTINERSEFIRDCINRRDDFVDPDKYSGANLTIRSNLKAHISGKTCIPEEICSDFFKKNKDGRAIVLGALYCVTYKCIFSDETFYSFYEILLTMIDHHQFQADNFTLRMINQDMSNGGLLT